MRNVGLRRRRRHERVEVHEHRGLVALGARDLGREQEGRRRGTRRCRAAGHGPSAPSRTTRAVSWSPRRKRHPSLELDRHRPRLRLAAVLVVPAAQPGGGAEHAVPVAGVEQGLERTASRPGVRRGQPARLAERRHLLPHRLRCRRHPAGTRARRRSCCRRRRSPRRGRARRRCAGPRAGRRGPPRRRACCGSHRGTASRAPARRCSPISRARASARSDQVTHAPRSPTTQRCPAMRVAAWASAGPGGWASSTSIACCSSGPSPSMSPRSNRERASITVASAAPISSLVQGEQLDRRPQVVVGLVEPGARQRRAPGTRRGCAAGAGRRRPSATSARRAWASDRAGSSPTARVRGGQQMGDGPIAPSPGPSGRRPRRPDRAPRCSGRRAVPPDRPRPRRAPSRAIRRSARCLRARSARGMRPYATSRTSTWRNVYSVWPATEVVFARRSTSRSTRSSSEARATSSAAPVIAPIAPGQQVRPTTAASCAAVRSRMGSASSRDESSAWIVGGSATPGPLGFRRRRPRPRAGPGRAACA